MRVAHVLSDGGAGGAALAAGAPIDIATRMARLPNASSRGRWDIGAPPCYVRSPAATAGPMSAVSFPGSSKYHWSRNPSTDVHADCWSTNGSVAGRDRAISCGHRERTAGQRDHRRRRVDLPTGCRAAAELAHLPVRRSWAIRPGNDGHHLRVVAVLFVPSGAWGATLPRDEPRSSNASRDLGECGHPCQIRARLPSGRESAGFGPNGPCRARCRAAHSPNTNGARIWQRSGGRGAAMRPWRPSSAPNRQFGRLPPGMFRPCSRRNRSISQISSSPDGRRDSSTSASSRST